MSSTTLKNSTPIRRKKRLLTASKKQIEKSSVPASVNEETKKRKKRHLNRPIANLSTHEETTHTAHDEKITVDNNATTSSSQPVLPVKRSIRASSEAIVKREKDKMVVIQPRSPTPTEQPLEEKPVIRKKRKLNSQKVIVPTTSISSDIVFEETGNISYTEYMESSSSNIPHHQNKPNIVIGVPSKRIRLKRDPPTVVPASPKPPPTSQPLKILDTLDLSQHSILPNSSYIAHLPNPQQRKSLTNDIVDSAEQTEDESDHEQTQLLISDCEENEEIESETQAVIENSSDDKHAEVSKSETQAVIENSSDDKHAEVSKSEKQAAIADSSDDKYAEVISDVLFTMMDNDDIANSDVSEFYDANSDFDADSGTSSMESQDIVEEPEETVSLKKTNSFWNSLFKSFSNK